MVATAKAGSEESQIVNAAESKSDPLAAAASAYHRSVRGIVRGYAGDLERLWAEFSQTVLAIDGTAPSEKVRELLQAANESYAQGVKVSEDRAEVAIEDSYRKFVSGLQHAIRAAKPADLSPERLAQICELSGFIARAAKGEYPAEWWNFPEPAAAG